MGRPAWAEKLLKKKTDGDQNSGFFRYQTDVLCIKLRFLLSLDDSDEELFRRTGNYLTRSTILRAGTIDCLRCADFKHDVAHSVRCHQAFRSVDSFEFIRLEIVTIGRVPSNSTRSAHRWAQSVPKSVPGRWQEE